MDYSRYRKDGIDILVGVVESYDACHNRRTDLRERALRTCQYQSGIFSRRDFLEKRDGKNWVKVIKFIKFPYPLSFLKTYFHHRGADGAEKKNFSIVPLLYGK